MQFLIEYAIRWRWGLAVTGWLLLALAYPVSTRLESEQSVASLFGQNDPTLRQYQDLKRWFGRNDVLVLMYRDQDLVSDQGLLRSKRLTERVKSTAGVTATLSPWVLNEAAKGMTQVNPLLPFGGSKVQERNPIPQLMQADDPVGSGLSEIFSGYTHSEDYRHAAVVAMIADADVETTVDALRRIAAEWAQEPGIDNVSLVGEPVLVDEAFALVRRDGARLAIVTVVLLSIVVLLALFDYRLVILLAMVIGWSVVMTKATMVIAGIALSLIASILTAIVTVVAVTAVLHLGVRYHSRRGRGFTPMESTREVMHRMAAPIFWTCATDAAGFAALWFSEILPVRQFGLMVALAAISVFVAVLLFSPTCLLIAELRLPTRFAPSGHRTTRLLRRACFQIATIAVRYRWATIAVAGLAMIVSLILVSRAETETSFLRNFRDDSSIVIDYGNVEDNLGGAGVWDLVLDVPDPISNDFLEDVLELESELLNQLGGPNGLNKAISIADATEVLGRSAAGKWMPASVRIAAMRTRLPTFIGALISDPIKDESSTEGEGTRRKLRIMLRSAEGLPAGRKRQLISEVESIAAASVARWQTDEGQAADSDRSAPVIVTGYYVIMTRLVDQLIRDQWRCFAASAAMIWLLMSIATRSVRLATAALVPNLLPAFLVLAVVSLGGGRINMGAAMIAAVSVGLSIDGSVHLLTAYRRRVAIGRSPAQAGISAAGNIGAPVLLATVALVVGFSVLSTSEFIPTATFGTLVAWTLVIGTLVNLTVLPPLVQTLASRRRSHRR